ncbi:UNVERIFIED_CONTAM: hypothetical protein Scaly_3098800 [Sesamum calycinum]|uniref:Uncharacterized protein n=1 Tax=Sesamum calycinum TaxID=2727403 RepID=A0AAW2JLP8_9LAMI
MEIDNKEPAGGPMIHFGPPDAQGVHLLHNDALVIFAIVANYTVQSIFVIQERSSTHGTYIASPLEPTRRTRVVHFLVVDMSPAYNLILGQPALNTFQAIDSIYHMKLKFLVGDKVGEVKGDQYTTRKWYVEVIKSSNNRMEVDLPSKKSSRSATQQEDQRANDLVGIDPSIAVHSLNIDPTCPPVKQKKGHFRPEKDKIIEVEVEIDWRKGLLDYLIEGIFHADEMETARLKSRAAKVGKFNIGVPSKAFNNATRSLLIPKPMGKSKSLTG